MVSLLYSQMLLFQVRVSIRFLTLSGLNAPKMAIIPTQAIASMELMLI